MKNIYIAFYYNKRTKTIHIKGGSTSLDPRLRMQMHFAHGTAGQHPYPNVLNEDDLIYTRQFKHFLDKEQKVINTIRFFADLVESKGYNAKLHHAPKSHGSSNPNPNVTDIDRVILKFLFKTLFKKFPGLHSEMLAESFSRYIREFRKPCGKKRNEMIKKLNKKKQYSSISVDNM